MHPLDSVATPKWSVSRSKGKLKKRAPCVSCIASFSKRALRVTCTHLTSAGASESPAWLTGDAMKGVLTTGRPATMMRCVTPYAGV